MSDGTKAIDHWLADPGLLARLGWSDWSSALAGLSERDRQGPAPRVVRRWRDILAARGEWARAYGVCRANVLAMTRHLGQQHPECLVELGVLGGLAARLGQAAEAEAALRASYTGLRSVLGGVDPRLAAAAAALARQLVTSERWAEAETLLETSLRIWRETAPEAASSAAAQLTEVRLRDGRPADARPSAREAWELSVRAAGPSHPRTLQRARTYANLMLLLERPEEALGPLRDLRSAATDAEATAQLDYELGVALERVRPSEESLRQVEGAVRATRALGGPGRPHPTLPERLLFLTSQLQRRGRAGEIEALLLESLEAERVLYGPQSPEVGARLAGVGNLLAALGRSDEAIGWWEAALGPLSAASDSAEARRTAGLLVDALLAKAEAAVGRRDLALARDLTAALERSVSGLGEADVRRDLVRRLAARLARA